MLLAVTALTVMAATTLMVIYVFQAATARSRTVRERMVTAPVAAPVHRSPLRRATSRMPFVDRLPLSAGSRERMQSEIEQAGKSWRVNEYLGVRLGSALLGALVGFIFGDSLGGPAALQVLVALGLMMVGWVAPRMYLRRAFQRRQRLIEQQLPDALTAIAKSLRAGMGLLQALTFAADETPEPLGGEFRSVLRDLQLGADPEVVFNDLSRRVASRDLEIAVTAIVIQRSIGGNLSEILNNVSNTVRERVKLKREIRVITSRERLTGNMVALLPIVVAILFILINPEVGTLLFTEPVGRIAVGIAIGFEVMGYWLIRRLSVVEV
jgi:tight adherence protein B